MVGAAPKALDIKLLRDLWRLRGQVLSIALIIACGVGLLIMSLSAVSSLEETARAYYERQYFAHVFIELKRAPESLARRAAALPGVRALETRVLGQALVDVEGEVEPVMARLVSLPDGEQPLLNHVVLRAGRLVRAGRSDEVVVGEAFAEAHGLELGDEVTALIGDRKRPLRVVGIGLSPEFIYTVGPGSLIPDDRRYGVFWLSRDLLAAAYDLEGAFNAMLLTLLPGARVEAVIERLDRLLADYGGGGAYARKDQTSHWFLMNEIRMLKRIGALLPVIFLCVAAFMVDMVLNRLIATQRGEIGLLKAFGYSDGAVAWHFAKLALAIGALGITVGFLIGAGLGRVNTELYADYYRFPFLVYRPDPKDFAIAGGAVLFVVLLATLRGVRRALSLSPAAAMAPPAPESQISGGFAETAQIRRFDQPTLMILRRLLRWPLRTGLTALGMSMASAVFVLALHWMDSIEYLVALSFDQAQHQDVTVELTEPLSPRVAGAFARLPGVMIVEPYRRVAVRVSANGRSRREGLTGLSPEARLQPVVDSDGRVVPLPPAGLLISTKLAEMLDLQPGGRVTVEVLQGRRPVVELPVVSLFETYLGTPLYMDLDALHDLLGEGPRVSGVHLKIDQRMALELYAALKDLPEGAGMTLRSAMIQVFYDSLAETLLIYIGFFVAFSSALAFGVAHNSLRISLSERARELATLRVLGFSRGAVAYVLFGEIALIALIGLPLGCWMGKGLAAVVVAQFDSPIFRMPLVVSPDTYGHSVIVGLVAITVSALVTYRAIARIDMVSALKTRE